MSRCRNARPAPLCFLWSTFAGPTDVNPFILDAATQGSFLTPYIPSLTGGAELYGLLDGVLSTDPFFASARAAAPAEATSALLRVHLGPAGYDFDFAGYDLEFLLNLTGAAPAGPQLGIVENGTGDTFLRPLLVGGWGNDPLFGGSGPQPLDFLPAYGVYGTLVPVHGTRFNFGDASQITTNAARENDQIFFLGADGPVDFTRLGAQVPGPGALALVGAGTRRAGPGRRRSRRPASPAATAGLQVMRRSARGSTRTPVTRRATGSQPPAPAAGHRSRRQDSSAAWS